MSHIKKIFLTISASTLLGNSLCTFADAQKPEDIYNKYCFVCHKTGVASAPILGNKEQWAPRIAQGMPVLINHAELGFNAMPPKGTCMDCTADDLKAVIEYMVNNSK